MPNCDHSPNPIDGNNDHSWCLATKLCRRCGASMAAVASGSRADHCEPGVTGISWVRASERLRDLVEGPTVQVPLLGKINAPPFSIGGFRFPDGSLDDQHDDLPPPSAA